MLKRLASMLVLSGSYKEIILKTTLILILALLSSLAFGQGDAPPFLQGLSQTTKTVGSVIRTPHNQTTKISASQTILETGSKNRLANPGFEHATASTSYPTATTGTAVGTYGVDTTTPFEGLKSITLSCAGGASGGTCTFYQDVTTLFETQALAMIYLSSSVNTSDVKVYARKNGSNTAFFKSALNTVVNTYVPYKVPIVAGTTSTGIAIEVTVAASATTTLKADEASVGYQDLKAETGVIEIQNSTVIPGSNVSGNVTGAFTSSNGVTSLYSYNSGTGVYTVLKNGAEFTVVGQNRTTTSASSHINILLNGSEYTGSDTVVGSGYQTTTTMIKDLAAGDTFACNNSGSASNSAITKCMVSAKLSARVSSYSSNNGDFGPTNGTCTGSWTSNTTYACKYSRKGGYAEIQYKISVTGTPGPAATDFYVNLPAELTGGLDKNRLLGTVDEVYYFGDGNWYDIGTNSGQVSVTADLNVSPARYYVRAQTNSTSTPNQVLRPTIPMTWATGDYVIFTFKVPIVGWDDSNITIANISGLESCADTYECTDTFSAAVDAAGGVTGENVDWINGSCSVVSTNQYTCPYKSGLKGGGANLSNMMSCSVDMYNNATATSQVGITGGSSSSQLTYETTRQTTAVAIAQPVMIVCQKIGSDFIGKTAKAVASDQNLRMPGAIKVAVYQAEVSSTDVVSEENADWINGNCTNATTGDASCTVNAGIFAIAPKCWMSEPATGAGNDPVACKLSATPTTTSVAILCKQAAASVNYGFTLFCMGVTP